MSNNPKIIHRTYFTDYPPYQDPFLHYLESWQKQMPDYEIMHWNSSNTDCNENEWMRRAHQAKAPVFFSEYLRWKHLYNYGGLYLDADCEIINGKLLDELIEQLYASDEYDTFLGVEEYHNGFPTAQSVATKPGSALSAFMVKMYETYLGGPLWHWREERMLLGPQLISLYFRENGYEENHGFPICLKEPAIIARVKVYTQDYFSPKFSINGTNLQVTENTCVYHLFANLNIDSVNPLQKKHRDNPLLFHEYLSCEDYLSSKDLDKLRIRNDEGKINYIKAMKVVLQNPKYIYKRLIRNER